MDKSDCLPGLDVIYYCYDYSKYGRANSRGAKKKNARVIKMGKRRATIQLEEDGTFRHVDPVNLRLHTREKSA